MELIQISRDWGMALLMLTFLLLYPRGKQHIKLFIGAVIVTTALLEYINYRGRFGDMGAVLFALAIAVVAGAAFYVSVRSSRRS